MKRVAIVQARIGSTRLPGKVLLPLAGTSILGCVVDRLRAASGLDDLVVATSLLDCDDAVVAECERLGVRSFRGSAEDVLARYRAAAAAAGAEMVVRITADCPLIDGALVDALLRDFELGEPCDYLSNTLVRSYPRGLDAEIVRFTALERADREATLPYEREHVTPYLYHHPEWFALRAYVDSGGEDRSRMRWTVDTAEDYAFVRAVYAACPHSAPREVATADVFRAIAQDPSLSGLNAAVRQKALGE
ncbi:MAG: cytidylyltransferase domain-containing protein [Bacillati bacterium]